MKHQKLTLLIALALVAGLLVACQGPGASTTETIKIGNIQDLTGFTAAWGEGMTNGAILAMEEINANGGLLGGRNLELISYDFKGQVPDSINAYNRLTNQDKVAAVLGSPNSAVHIALGPVAAEQKVPIVADPMDERATTPAEGQLNEYIFLLSEPSASQQARIIASYSLNELGLKRVAVLYDQGNPYAVSLAGPFVDYYVRHGGVIVANEPFESGTKDFRTHLLKIMADEPDAIHITNYLQENILIAQQMRELGIDLPLIGNNSFFTPYAEQACPDANNSYFPNNVTYDDPDLVEFIENYQTRFGKDPVVHVFMGYDNMMMVAEAIERAGSTDPEAIMKELKNTKDHQGLVGTITADPATHRPVNLPMVVMKIEDCGYTAVATDVLPEE